MEGIDPSSLDVDPPKPLTFACEIIPLNDGVRSLRSRLRRLGGVHMLPRQTETSLEFSCYLMAVPEERRKPKRRSTIFSGEGQVNSETIAVRLLMPTRGALGRRWLTS